MYCSAILLRCFCLRTVVNIKIGSPKIRRTYFTNYICDCSYLSTETFDASFFFCVPSRVRAIILGCWGQRENYRRFPQFAPALHPHRFQGFQRFQQACRLRLSYQ